MVALLFGYEMLKNIYTDILNGPLKEIKLEVKNRGEVVAPWYYAKESRLSTGKWIQGANGMVGAKMFCKTGKHYANARLVFLVFCFYRILISLLSPKVKLCNRYI